METIKFLRPNFQKIDFEKIFFIFQHKVCVEILIVLGNLQKIAKFVTHFEPLKVL